MGFAALNPTYGTAVAGRVVGWVETAPPSKPNIEEFGLVLLGFAALSPTYGTAVADRLVGWVETAPSSKPDIEEFGLGPVGLRCGQPNLRDRSGGSRRRLG